MRAELTLHAPMKCAAVLLIAVFASGCVGNITTPLPPGPNPVSIACPVLGPTINVPVGPGNCSGIRLSSVMLTCAGGQVPLSLSTTPGGATRLDGTLSDGSVVTATATPVNALCFDGIPVNIGITLGMRYVGEQGQEITGPTTGTGCIVRSRADFSQFVTTDPLLIHPGVEEFLKGKLHERLDKQVVAGRCLRWQQL